MELDKDQKARLSMDGPFVLWSAWRNFEAALLRNYAKSLSKKNDFVLPNNLDLQNGLEPFVFLQKMLAKDIPNLESIILEERGGDTRSPKERPPLKPKIGDMKRVWEKLQKQPQNGRKNSG